MQDPSCVGRRDRLLEAGADSLARVSVGTLSRMTSRSGSSERCARIRWVAGFVVERVNWHRDHRQMNHGVTPFDCFTVSLEPRSPSTAFNRSSTKDSMRAASRPCRHSFPFQNFLT